MRCTRPARDLPPARTAARNARRHGLTVPVLDEPSLVPEVVALARRVETSVTPCAADAAGHALACRIAEAMIDLKRVRLAKHPLVVALHADPCDRDALAQVRRLDRYERGALGRRKRAIREFTARVAPIVVAARARLAQSDKTKPTEKRQ